MEQGSPPEDRVKVRVVEFIYQDELIYEDGEHKPELNSELVIVLLELTEHVSYNDNLIQKNQQSQIRCSFPSLAFRNEEEELSFIFLQVKLQKIARSLNKVIKLILSGRLDNYPIIEVLKIVIKTKDVHRSWVELV